MFVGRLLTVAIVILGLAACVDGKRLDSVLNPVPLEEDEGSKAVKSYRGVADGKSVLFKGNGEEAYDITYQARLTAAARDYDNHDKAYRYLQSGTVLSDQICSEWFRRLGRAQAKVNADRDVISNVGALSAAILGLADVSSQIVGGVAAGAGFLEDTYTSELANFVVAPDVSQVERVIELNRIQLTRNFATNFEANKARFNFEVARGLLIRYDNSCSHLAVKRQVNKIIAAQSTKKEKNLISPLDQQALVMIVGDIEALFTDGAKPLSIEDTLDLYMVMIGANVPSGDKSKKLGEMKKAGRLLDNAGNVRLKNAGQSSRLRRKLLNAARFGNFDARIAESVRDKKQMADEAKEEQEKKKKDAAKAEKEAEIAEKEAIAATKLLDEANLRVDELSDQVAAKVGAVESMRERATTAEAHLTAARVAVATTATGNIRFWGIGISPEEATERAVALAGPEAAAMTPEAHAERTAALAGLEAAARVFELELSKEAATAEFSSEAKRLDFLEEGHRKAMVDLDNARERLAVAKALAEKSAAVAASLRAEADIEPVLPSFLEILESKGGTAGRGIGALGVIQEVE